MDSPHIKTAALTDLDIIAELFDAYRQFYEQAPDVLAARNFIEQRLQNNESIILLAQDNNKNALGFCQLYPTFCSVIAAPIYVLYDLFVTPSARRSGAGKKLLLAAETLAKQQGIARLDLTTAKTNLTAQALYESLGWQRDGVFIAYNKAVD
ncbi:MAG: GNAT family N-acetyltransferase [Marinagarivorans sp.]|nr:GNAT family N-acetyltransferase [Marinagarivorans sp.]